MNIAGGTEEAPAGVLEIVVVLRDFCGWVHLIGRIPRSDFPTIEKIARLSEQLESALADLSAVTLDRLEEAIKAEAHPHSDPFGVCGPHSSGRQLNGDLFILRDAASEIVSWKDGPTKIPVVKIPGGEPGYGMITKGDTRKHHQFRRKAVERLASAIEYHAPGKTMTRKAEIISEWLGWIVDDLDLQMGITEKTIQADLTALGEIHPDERERRSEERRRKALEMYQEWKSDQ